MWFPIVLYWRYCGKFWPFILLIYLGYHVFSRIVPFKISDISTYQNLLGEKIKYPNHLHKSDLTPIPMIYRSTVTADHGF